MNVHTTLIHAVTAYDRRQQGKPGYNIYALPQYLGAVKRIAETHEETGDVRGAILAHTHGRLANACLKAVGEPPMTREEIHGF